ncbi:outer membrane lipoprotein carrier protein LolA [Oligoflexia bacterium]|nr:outer membrane lipoprotein carrier protein LolA [Oligoflexia bacterium]
MRKAFIPFVIAVLYITIHTAVAVAEEGAFSCQGGNRLSAKASTELVQKVQKAYAALSGIEASFTQSGYMLALEMTELSSGRMWFEKPGKMKWHYFEPEEQIFVIQNNTFWLYQIVDQQVLISDLEEVLISDLPVSFLLGVGDLAKDFKVLEACSNREGWALKLQPQKKQEIKEQGAAKIGKADALQSFALLVDRANYYPMGALVTDAGGNTTSILLSELKTDPTTTAETFSTTFPKGIDVDDRREVTDKSL